MMRRNFSGGAPMVSNQIRELDLELELLKRKRLLIEQEQQLLASKQIFNRGSQYDDKPRQEYGRSQFNRPQPFTHNYSHLYENASGSSNSESRQFGGKRPAPPVWQSDIPHKRYAGPQKDRNVRPQPRYNNPPRTQSNASNKSFNQRGPTKRPSDQTPSFRPLMSIKTDPIKPARKDFQPSKVSKAKKPFAPNRLDSYSTSEKKHLISSASELAQPVYHPDVDLDKHSVGRLELALGHIFKEMKERFQAQFPQVLGNMHAVRKLKSVIRERIREFMLGKVIGKSVEIVDIYRDKYPAHSDLDTLKVIEEELTKRERHEPGRRPEHVYAIKQKIRLMLPVALEEMLDKLQEIYTENNVNTEEAVSESNENKAKDEKDKGENEQPTNEDVAPQEADKNGNETTNVLPEEAHKNGNETNKTIVQDVDIKNISNAKDKEVSPNNIQNEKDESDMSETGKTSDIQQNESLNNDSVDFTADVKVEEITAEKMSTNKKATEDENEDNENWMVLLKSKLPKILKGNIQKIVNTLNTDELYYALRSSDSYPLKLEQKKPEKSTSDYFFVTVVGVPSLPKRPVMQCFLDQFTPKTIKKHKNVRNLLFVGVGTKKDYDHILAANGTMIGKIKINIKVSEKQKKIELERRKKEEPQENAEQPKNNNAVENDDVQIVNDEKSNEVIMVDDTKGDEGDSLSNTFISSGLDEQITDLLESIKQGEEERVAEENLPPVTENPENKDGATNETAVEVGGNPETENGEQLSTIAELDEEVTENTEANKTENEEMTDNSEGNKTNNEENTDNLKVNETEQGAETVKTTPEPKQVEDLKNEDKGGSAKATPVRTSSRLANVTPRTIRTRRSSKLGHE